MNEYSVKKYQSVLGGVMCQVYELWKDGKLICSLSCQLRKDGSIDPAGEKEFYRRAEIFIDRDKKSNTETGQPC